MLLVEALCVLTGFSLYLSDAQSHTFCGLNGLAVELRCSARDPTSSLKWYIQYENTSICFWKKISADGNHGRYRISEENNFTLTIHNLTDSDENDYCCTDTDVKQTDCWLRSLKLLVTDLQVKVLPATEGQTASLMCSTSCPLTENPAGYIWYKNGELLYQDWSPWYQELVSTEHGTRYSCAIKGHEDLRAAEVSVDSITPTCFSVTYTEGSVCANKTSVGEKCTITYPREVGLHVQKSSAFFTLTCNTSCPMADPHTAFNWYQEGRLQRGCEKQDLTVFNLVNSVLACSVKGRDDLRSDHLCINGDQCALVNYVRRRICSLEGSSVNITSTFIHSRYWSPQKIWTKVKTFDDFQNLNEEADHLTFIDNIKNQHTLRIDNLRKNDSAEYTFSILEHEPDQFDIKLPGVTLVVTGLKVTFSPSAVVMEGRRITLNCSTSCPLADNTNYIWFFNGRPLTQPENQNKHLVLDPVNSRNAGNYTCAVKTSQNISPMETLTVQPLKEIAILNGVKLTVLAVALSSVCLICLLIRKKKTVTSTDKLSDNEQTERMEPLYESIALRVMTPAALTEAAAQQEDTL